MVRRGSTCASSCWARYKLKQIRNEIDNHVKNIKLAIEQDPHLSGDISTVELQNRITDLKDKKEKYNQLKGFVQNKNSLTSQFDAIKEDIGVCLNQIEIIQNKIDASSYDGDKFEQVIYRFEMYGRRRETFNNELSGIKGRARELIATVKNLKEKIETSNKFQQEYDDISDYLFLLNTSLSGV